MKYFNTLILTILAVSGWTIANSQDMDAEVPGDHFSLEGALELFKQSESPEEFERLLNSPDSKVNNLDLNGDGYIDYIRVFDRYEGNVHVFILQAVVSDSENQDVAVIELEKLSNGKAVLQIIGDEDIYGIETIIEPTREVRTYAGTQTTTTVINVWSWPVVHHVYSPHYIVWHSPWGWHSRPVWWRTWRPVVFVHYYDHWRPYRPYYSACHSRRVVYAHHIYYPHRTTSVIVRERHHRQVERYRTAKRDHRGGSDDDSGSRMSRSSRSGHYERSDSFANGRRTLAEKQDIASWREQSKSSGQTVNNSRGSFSEVTPNGTFDNPRKTVDNTQTGFQRSESSQWQRSNTIPNSGSQQPQRQLQSELEKFRVIQQHNGNVSQQRNAPVNTQREIRPQPLMERNNNAPARTQAIQKQSAPLERSNPSGSARLQRFSDVSKRRGSN